ncbi:MAG: phenylacetate--CoA ligase family protein, partial [bacterium]
SLSDIRWIPILRKEEIRQMGEKLYSKIRESFKPYLFQTGGSTGTPLEFLNDKHLDRASCAFLWRYRKWAGFDTKDRLVIIRYRDLSRSKNDPPYEIVGNKLYISAFHIKGENIRFYLDLMRKFKPKAAFVFPSAFYTFAVYMKKNGLMRYVNIPIITTSSETIFKPQRELIEDAFCGKIFDWYGSNENVVSAGECEHGNMHINVEFGLLEVVDKNGNPIDEGKEGIIVGTSFWRMAMPFIRYALGDYGAISWENCPCGRKLPILKKLEGRIDDFIITKDHRIVGRLDEAFHYSKGILKSQIVQDEPGKIKLRVVKDEKVFSDEDIIILKRELVKRLGDDMEIEFEFVDDIPLTQRGKFKSVVSHLKVEDYL